MRQHFDGRLVTHCDGCGNEIEGPVVGSHGLTELLGLRFCRDCADADEVDFPSALLNSGLLSETGKQAVADWLHLQAPADVQELLVLLREGEPPAIDPTRRN